jgi:hypothetical protein
MHVEVIGPHSVEGAFDARPPRPPAYIPFSSMKLRGAFGARPPTCIPNNSPSQVRFKSAILKSRSYDLFHEGP